MLRFRIRYLESLSEGLVERLVESSSRNEYPCLVSLRTSTPLTYGEILSSFETGPILWDTSQTGLSPPGAGTLSRVFETNALPGGEHTQTL